MGFVISSSRRNVSPCQWLHSKTNLIAISQIGRILGEETGCAPYHRITCCNEFLGAEYAGAVIASDLLKAILSKRDHQVVIFGVPVLKGRDVESTINAIQIVILILDLPIRCFGKLNDALMAAAGDAHQSFILNINTLFITTLTKPSHPTTHNVKFFFTKLEITHK